MTVKNRSVGATRRYEYTENGVLISQDTIRQTAVWTNDVTGQSVADYRGKIRRGENATSPFSAVSSEILAVDLDSQLTYTTTPIQGSKIAVRSIRGAVLGSNPGNPSSLSVSFVEKRARERFLSTYRSRRTALQGGVLLGELMKTVRMIRNPAQALRTGIDDYYATVKKRLRRNPRRPNNVVARTWLEYVYGWQPLINDVRDAAKLATAHPFSVREPIQAHEVEEGTPDNQKYDNWLSWGFLQLGIRVVVKRHTSAHIRGAVVAENSPPPFPEQLGFSWSNFLPTVWELIPFSFLVDYFTNVGAVIEGISTGSIQLAWGSASTIKEYSQEIEIFPNMVQMQSNLAGRPFSAYATGSGKSAIYRVVSRSPISGLSYGIRDLGFKLPGSSTKWLNILALAKLRT